MNAPFAHIDQLAGWLDGTDIDVLELSSAGHGVRLKRGADGVYVKSSFVPSLAEPARKFEVSCSDIIRASGVGVFLDAHPLHEAPLVRVGQTVKSGQMLGLLKTGPLLAPVRAPAAGIVLAVIPSNGALVDFGAPLVQLADSQGGPGAH